jgi:hypothetical protein
MSSGGVVVVVGGGATKNDSAKGKMWRTLFAFMTHSFLSLVETATLEEPVYPDRIVSNNSHFKSLRIWRFGLQLRWPHI